MDISIWCNGHKAGIFQTGRGPLWKRKTPRNSLLYGAVLLPIYSMATLRCAKGWSLVFAVVLSVIQLTECEVIRWLQLLSCWWNLCWRGEVGWTVAEKRLPCSDIVCVAFRVVICTFPGGCVSVLKNVDSVSAAGMRAIFFTESQVSSFSCLSSEGAKSHSVWVAHLPLFRTGFSCRVCRIGVYDYTVNLGRVHSWAVIRCTIYSNVPAITVVFHDVIVDLGVRKRPLANYSRIIQNFTTSVKGCTPWMNTNTWNIRNNN